MLERAVDLLLDHIRQRARDLHRALRPVDLAVCSAVMSAPIPPHPQSVTPACGVFIFFFFNITLLWAAPRLPVDTRGL